MGTIPFEDKSSRGKKVGDKNHWWGQRASINQSISTKQSSNHTKDMPLRKEMHETEKTFHFPYHRTVNLHTPAQWKMGCKLNLLCGLSLLKHNFVLSKESKTIMRKCK